MHARVKFAVVVAIAAVIGMGTVAVADNVRERDTLTSFQEVPALATPGVGEFKIELNRAGDALSYSLSFSGLESDVTQSHIHFENATNSGPVIVFLCTNLGNSPVAVQACPAAGGTITGTIRAGDVIGQAGGAAVGIASGDFADLVRALKAGATYVNVHSTTRPAGEIRAQIGDDDHDHF